MLIVLDTSIKDAVNQGSLTDDHISVIEEMAIAAKRGRHALTSLDLDVLDALSQFDNLSRAGKSIYHQIKNKWGEHKSLKSVVSKRLVVGLFNNFTVPTLQSNGDIKIDLSFIQHSEILQSTILLLENTREEVVYKFIFSSFFNAASKKHHSTWEVKLGGGDTTSQVYGEDQSRARLQRSMLNRSF